MTSVGTPGNQAQLQDELATVTLSVRDGSPIFEEHETQEAVSEKLERLLYVFTSIAGNDVCQASSLAKLLLDSMILLPEGQLKIFAAIQLTLYRDKPFSDYFSDGRSFVDTCMKQMQGWACSNRNMRLVRLSR